MGSVKHRCGQSPAGPDPVDPRPGPAPADRRGDPVPDESWAEYRLVIRSGEYEFCSEWTRDYDTVIGWDNDSPPDWIVERRGVSVTPPQRPVTAGPDLRAAVRVDVHVAERLSVVATERDRLAARLAEVEGQARLSNARAMELEAERDEARRRLAEVEAERDRLAQELEDAVEASFL